MFVVPELHNVYGVGTFSKNDKPFNVSHDDWAARFWNKWVGKNADEATPKPGGCLLVVVLPDIGDNLAYKHGLHSCQEVNPYRNQNKV
jgi:hypothetical protein